MLAASNHARRLNFPARHSSPNWMPQSGISRLFSVPAFPASGFNSLQQRVCASSGEQGSIPCIEVPGCSPFAMQLARVQFPLSGSRLLPICHAIWLGFNSLWKSKKTSSVALRTGPGSSLPCALIKDCVWAAPSLFICLLVIYSRRSSPHS